LEDIDADFFNPLLMCQASGPRAFMSIPKLEDAVQAGKRRAAECAATSTSLIIIIRQF